MPGPDHDRLPGEAGAARRHLPRGRGERRLPLVRPRVRWLAGGASTCACAVSDDARGWPSATSAAIRACCSTASRWSASPRPTPWPTDGPTDPVPRPPRAPQGPRRAARRPWPSLPPDVRVWVAARDPRPTRLRQRHAGDPRIEWLGPGVATRRSSARLRRRRRLLRAVGAAASRSASCCSRRWRPSTADRGVSDLPGYRNVARPDRDARARPPGRRRALWRGALQRGAGRPRCWPAGWSSAGEERADEFSMDHLAERYLELYERAIALRPLPSVPTLAAPGDRRPDHALAGAQT